MLLSCMQTTNLLEKEIVKPAKSKFIVRLIENPHCLSDEEFKAHVIKTVYSEKWIEKYGIPIDIKYDEAQRIHKTYLIRAWIYYKREIK